LSPLRARSSPTRTQRTRTATLPHEASAREAYLLRLVASWAAAAVVGGFVVGKMLEPSRRPPSEPVHWSAEPEEVAQFAPDAGVGEEAQSTPYDVPMAVVPHLAVGRPMLKQPLPDQRRPPCGFGETPINGGCWVEAGRVKPPCGDRMFEHEGYCYFPAFNEPPRPASNPPK
jgi:hypothetical protein